MNQYVYLRGEGKWAQKLITPDDHYGPPKYSVQVKLNDASKAVYVDIGLKNKPNKDGFYTFRRNHDPLYDDDGKMFYQGGPPKITNADGTPFDQTKLIGHGSILTVKLEIYKTRMGMASRIEEVRVEDLIEFIPPEDVVPEGVSPF